MTAEAHSPGARSLCNAGTGAAAGVIAATFVCPLDVIKTRFQVHGLPALGGASTKGDVLLHCVVDAILGGLGLPDIGHILPDTNPKWKGADSLVFMKEAETGKD